LKLVQSCSPQEFLDLLLVVESNELTGTVFARPLESELAQVCNLVKLKDQADKSRQIW
jgi:hypothetical protein